MSLTNNFSDIFAKLKSSAPELIEQDLDQWVLPELMIHYLPKLRALALYAYTGSGHQHDQNLASAAFQEQAKIELRSALVTFFFRLQHWKENRDLNPYLVVCLQHFAERIHRDLQGIKKEIKPICPACQLLKKKEFLSPEGDLWRCRFCTQILELNQIHNKLSQSQSRLHQIFALHSRKGYRCPDCLKFLPASSNGEFGLSCPYEDCIFMGTVDNLEKMEHPGSQSYRNDLSLQASLSGSDSSNLISFQDLLASDEIRADSQLIIQEQTQQEYQLLQQVLTEQMSSVKLTSAGGTLAHKMLMYQAYQIMVDKYPYDMVAYLVHRKQRTDFPIQARIFQEYATLVEGYLPFKLVKNRNQVAIDIVDLCDPDLALFLGESIFEAEVDKNHLIPNLTQETYVGGKQFIDYGPCFLGKLISVADRVTGQILTPYVVEYSFAQIKMQPQISPGTPVRVKHYRIPSHYQLAGMSHLQKTRRQIVDKIYLRLNKKKRLAGE